MHNLFTYRKKAILVSFLIIYICCNSSAFAKNKTTFIYDNLRNSLASYTYSDNVESDTTTGDHKKSIGTTNLISITAIYTILVISLFIYLYLKIRKKYNDRLTFQELNLEQQKNEFKAQQEEWEIQKNLVIHQRDKIITMLTDLGESIDYARKIQQAILPSENYMNSILNDYFLIFQPRESVGGDFYWVSKYGNLTCFAVADCTGHGVPGGFMSMLGTTMLNDVLIRSTDLNPASILDQLRGKMIKSLNQTGKDEDSQDGMDICLCVLDMDTNELVYAGANLPVFIISSNIPEPSDKISIYGSIIELKANRMPISYYQKMSNFSETKIKLNTNDIIYLFSDGFVDQFGGPLNKKFGYSAFRSLIQSVSKEPIEKQKAEIWSAFDHWKGAENQTDDVIILGIKI